MFGENLPQEALKKAEYDAMHCKVFIVAGTSAQVMPASLLPSYAKRGGAAVIEVNLENTQLTYSITDIQLRGSTAIILPALVNEVKKLL